MQGLQGIQGLQGGINPMVQSPEALQQMLRSMTPQQNQMMMMKPPGSKNDGNESNKKW